MKIAIGSDHGGYDLKEQLKYYLTKNGYEVIDVGTYSKDSCHYPEFAIKCARQVSDGVCQFGVIVCTTGEGVTMAANKIKGIRAGLAYNTDVAPWFSTALKSINVYVVAGLLSCFGSLT